MTLLHNLVKSKEVSGLKVMNYYRTGGFDLTKYDVWLYPTTVHLVGADGSVGHNAIIVKEWIFDIMMLHALPLLRELRNRFCSINIRHVFFVGTQCALQMALTGKCWSRANRLLEQC